MAKKQSHTPEPPAFRPLRRHRQALDAAACEAILHRGSAGVLALAGDNDYPYAVPLSYVYADGVIWFHSAREGHKLDALRRNPKASFCVVDQDEVVPLEYTTRFRSVIAFGTVRELTDPDEKMAAIRRLALKYAPADTEAHRQASIDPWWASLCVLALTIEHLSGKEAIELVRERTAAD